MLANDTVNRIQGGILHQQAKSSTHSDRSPADAAAGDVASSVSQATEPKQFLYEPRFGLPVVRKYLKYGELLRDIRTEKIDSVKFFSQHEQVDLEGPCLVVYKDGSLAQSYVPGFDYRVPYAMENHGVQAVRLPSEPLPDNSASVNIWTEAQYKTFYKVMPVIGIAIVYAATQLAAKLKVCFCALESSSQSCASQTQSASISPEQRCCCCSSAVFADSKATCSSGCSCDWILASLL